MAVKTPSELNFALTKLLSLLLTHRAELSHTIGLTPTHPGTYDMAVGEVRCTSTSRTDQEVEGGILNR